MRKNYWKVTIDDKVIDICQKKEDVYKLMKRSEGWRYLVNDDEFVVAIHDYYGLYIAFNESS